MDVLSWLRTLLAGRTPSEPLAARRERREAARQHHHVTGEPAWTSDDRHLGPDGTRLVEDVAPGTPGHFGSVHTVKDD